MLYCEPCKLLCPDGACDRCGSKKLREPKANDPVYLTTKDSVWSGGVEDILARNEIPYLKQGSQGAGVTSRIGYSMENYQFFVPLGAYEKSKELLASIMSGE